MTEADRDLLLIPGPTPVTPTFAEAMARPMIDHRGPEFAAILRACVAGLRWAFQTRNEVFILTGSGTSAMEAAIVNTLSPGDRVLAVSAGSFGDRFGHIAQRFGAAVEILGFPWGEAIDLDAVHARLRSQPYRAVLTTFNETSTGVMHDLATLAQGHDALVLVDAISGALVADLPMDAWGIDVCVASSQKAFSIPPGLSFIALSERAAVSGTTAKMPRFALDLAPARDFAAKGQTPFTPAIPQFYALQASLDELQVIGLESLFRRHAARAAAVRDGVRALHLDLFARSHYSPAVTAVRAPQSIPVKRLLAHLRERYALTLAGGQDHLADAIFRIGHLGLTPDGDYAEALARLGRGLSDLGWDCDPSAGATAVDAALSAPAP